MDVRHMTYRTAPRIGSVILNWNRLHRLKVTVESYLSTITVPFELVIVDNASSDGSREYIESVCRAHGSCSAVLLPTNLGGEAINAAVERLTPAPFLHITENDIEYLPGWSDSLLSKFEAFPELGQLSPMGPRPQTERGEVGGENRVQPLTRSGQTIFVAEYNIGTTCMLRRTFWDGGLRWRSLSRESSSEFLFPDDTAISAHIKAQGCLVAYNDRYAVINWGHNVHEMQGHVEYYLQNYRAKPWHREDGMRLRLRALGYDLKVNEGTYEIVKDALP